MDLFRQVIRVGGAEDGEDDTDDGMEEEALLLHEAESSSTQASSSDEEDGATESASNRKRFDVSLPARHLYLGEMEEEGQTAMEDEESTPTLPLLNLPERVLFPGETLPMHIYNPHAIQMLRDVATRQKPVAIVTDLREASERQIMTRPTQQELSQVGTTAEVVALRDEEPDTQYWGPCLIVKLLGRQRFRLMEVIRRANGQMDCCVAILPERTLPPRPLDLFACPPCVYSGGVATRLVARAGEMSAHSINKYSKILQRPSLYSSLCQVPEWVFTLYDVDYLRCKIVREEMMMVSAPEGLASGRLPEDTVSLSYWLSRRLPISDREKLGLLSLDCPTQRLLRGLHILEKLTDLCCISCGKVITKKAHLFSMSVDGPVASYVNPGGFVHDTLTSRQAENFRTHGSPSTEHSWFPGYSWTILECCRCGEHKGWLFQATRRGLNPAQFYGLRRQCLEHKPGGAAEGEGGGVEGRGRRPLTCAPS